MAKRELDIATALTDAAKESIGTLGPISYPNAELKEKTGTWFSVFIVPAGSDAVTIGKGGQDEESGFMQIDINTPRGTGDGEALEIADTIGSDFPSGRRLFSNGHQVNINGCSRSPARHIGDWYRISLTINYYSRTTREHNYG